MQNKRDARYIYIFKKKNRFGHFSYRIFFSSRQLLHSSYKIKILVKEP